MSSFFEEINAICTAAERATQASYLTADDIAAIAKVKAWCLDPKRIDEIRLAAAERFTYSYCLYKGNDLMVLRHLLHPIQSQIIDDIINTIRRHYGHGFTVYHLPDTASLEPFYQTKFMIAWRVLISPVW